MMTSEPMWFGFNNSKVSTKSKCANPVSYENGQSINKKYDSYEPHLGLTSHLKGTVSETSATLPRYEDTSIPKASELLSEVELKPSTTDGDTAMGDSSVSTIPPASESSSKTIEDPTTNPQSTSRASCKSTNTRYVEMIAVPRTRASTTVVPTNMTITRYPPARTTIIREVESGESSALMCIMVVWVIIGLSLLAYLLTRIFYRHRYRYRYWY